MATLQVEQIVRATFTRHHSHFSTPTTTVDNFPRTASSSNSIMTRVTDAHQSPHEFTKLLSTDGISSTTRNNLPRHAGLVALGALIWSWVLQAEASQALQAVEFNKPFFILCFNHTAPVALLPLLVGYFWLQGGDEDRLAPLDFVGVLNRHSVIPLPTLWKIAMFLSTFYCVTDYFWYAALANVSVAAGTAIFNCSPLFVYCFSICFLHERLSLGKMCGVLTSFVGVTLVVMFQNGSGLDAIASTGVVAGLMVALSAALYGGYEVAIRLTVGDDMTDTATLLTMAGLCGLFTIPLWVIGSFLLAYSPVEAIYEPLGLPDTPHGLVLMLVSGLMAIVFCVFLPLSLCWTSPLETSVGCMLTIPLSGIVDTVIHHTSFSWECIAGSALVMGGFGILEYCSAEDTIRQPEASKQRDDPNVLV